MRPFYLWGAPEHQKALVLRKGFPSPLNKVKTLLAPNGQKPRVKTANQRDTEEEQKTQYLEEEGEELQPSSQRQEEQGEKKAVFVRLISLCQKQDLEKQKIPESAAQQQRVQVEDTQAGKEQVEVTDNQTNT